MRDILNSYTSTELRKHISTYNKSLGLVKGYSKMNKSQLIDLMTKKENVNKFKSIKMKVKPDRKKPEKKTTTKTQPKKQTTTTPPKKQTTTTPPKKQTTTTPPKQQTTTPPKQQPKKQPSKKQTPKFTFGIITKERINPDFNFSRNFDYKTKKTKDGYEWTFKNQDDYDTAWDITSFIPEYKDTSRFKWYEKTPYTLKIFVLQEKLKQIRGTLNEMNRDPALREPRGSKEEKIKSLKDLEKRFNKIKTSSQKIINDFKKKNKIPDDVIEDELKEGNYLYNIDTIPKFIKQRLDKLK